MRSPVCARRGACMLRAGVEVVSEVVDCEAFARAFVMFEVAEVQVGQPEMLTVVWDPALS